MTEFDGFRPAAQRFFRSLARNNNRTWFEANRAIYEQEIREPLKALVEAVDVRLAALAPELTGDPKRSLFRINRDIRFSKDKSPYKTNAGCWFYHQDAGRGVGQEADGGGAGYYFHLDGSSAFVAGGIWSPARPALNKIRSAIAGDYEGLSAILGESKLKRRFGKLDAEMKLSRVPRGFAPDHPAGELLKQQSFTLGRTLAAGECDSRKLVDVLAKDFATMLPLVRWLNRSLGYTAAKSRL